MKAGRPQGKRRQPTPASPQDKHGHSLAEGLALAGRVIGEVVRGASLTAALVAVREERGLRAAAQDFSYKALRGYGRVNAIIDRLTDKPVDDDALYGLLMAALAELISRPATAHAVVHQAVEATALLGRARAGGLVNAVLRRYLREGQALLDEITASEEGRYCHPQWWIERLKSEYPDRYGDILEQGNLHPPMTLRVNVRKNSVAAYMERLSAAGIAATHLWGEAILLARPQRVESLPGFLEGAVSVQDAGAQHTARLLDLRHGMSVLDACAAPGGKVAHILERFSCELLAADSSPDRVRRIEENLARLGLKAEVKTGDSLNPQSYAGGRVFDRVLLDAPCTASGVVRRHPDIKWLRRESDIASFAGTQALLLDALWRVLASDGKLLYVTCSVFPEENRLQVESFLARHQDAQALPVEGIPGGQMLPGADADGFFYALLYKGR